MDCIEGVEFLNSSAYPIKEYPNQNVHTQNFTSKVMEKMPAEQRLKMKLKLERYEDKIKKGKWFSDSFQD